MQSSWRTAQYVHIKNNLVALKCDSLDAPLRKSNSVDQFCSLRSNL